MAIASDNQYPKVVLTEQSVTPSNPSAGDQKLFIRESDHKLCLVDSSGSVVVVEGASITVKELDNSPSVIASTIKFPNGTLTDNGDGSVTYTPAASAGYTQGARVYPSADQSIVTTGTILAFNTEDFDTDTIHDVSTNNSRLTCKTAGIYLIIASLDTENMTSFELQILLNGTTRIQNVSGAGEVKRVICSTIYSLSINDYVEAKVIPVSNKTAWGGATNGTKFMMQRIG